MIIRYASSLIGTVFTSLMNRLANNLSKDEDLTAHEKISLVSRVTNEYRN